MKHVAPRAAALLRAFLQRNNTNLPKFCEAYGLCRISTMRYMNGDRGRIPVSFAAAVERATGGLVPCAAWAEIDEEQPKAAA